MWRTQLYFLSLRHWSIDLQDVVFIHVPGAGGALFIEEFDDHHKNITFLLPKELNEKVAKHSLHLVRAMVLGH